MTDQKIRIGIVGAGTNTKARHIPGLMEIPDVEILSVCNRTEESSRRAAEQFGISKTFTDWRQLVADEDIDAVVIGTWPYMHCPVTLAALKAGKHVMCEARMAMNAAEARKMLKASEEHPNLIAQVVPSPMTLRIDETIKKMLADGFVGSVLAIEIRDCSGFLEPNAPLTWRQNFAYSGYNVMTMGIWYEAVMRWVGLAGRVMAMDKIFVAERVDEAGKPQQVCIPDHLDVLAELACGGQLHIQNSRVTGLAGKAEAWIFGSKGTLMFCDDKLFAGKKGDSRLAEVQIPSQQQGRWRVEEEFINAIRGKEKIKLTTFADGVRYMEFTDAVAKSLAHEKAIDVPQVIKNHDSK